MIPRLLILVFILTTYSESILAQGFPLSINIQVNPPYTADYSAYFGGGSQVLVTITNNTATPRNIYLAGKIATIDGEIEVRTSAASPWPGPPLVVPPGIHLYSGNDLLPFSENSNVEYTGITRQDLVNGILPEGEYQICMTAYDYVGLQALSATEPMGCSNVFSIRYPSPPQIISPECNSHVNAVTPTSLLFNWQIPVGLPPGVTPQYRFKLVLLPDGIDAQSALESSVDPVYQSNVMSPSFLYNSTLPLLQTGKRYAWWVQAYDPNPTTKTVFQNKGYSEPCIFYYMSEGSSGGAFTMVYPVSGDTLPWTYMPFIHRFDPYSNDYVGHNRTFRLTKNGSQVDVFSRDMNWPSGPERSQEAALGGIDITREEAQHINLYKRIDDAHPPVQFEHSNSYGWNADIQLENAAGPDIFGSLSGTFVSGMGKPRPLSPPSGDTLKKNEELDLRFQTAAAPNTLVPALNIMQTSRTQHGPAFFNGGINERWKIELSRCNTFSDILYSDSKRVGNTLDYLSGLCSESCLIDTLYREETRNYTPRDTGWYYWRISWLSNAGDPSSSAYRTSAVWKFYVSDTLVHKTQTDSIRPTPGECVNTCEGPTIAASEKVPVTTTAVGNVVKIGLFEMKVTEITWSGSSARGKGTILVPMMRAPMKVKFNNIKINAANRVYEGSVLGEYDNEGIIPEGIREGLATMTNMNEDEAKVLNTYVNAAGRLVSQFAMDIPVGLPIGIDTEVDDQRVTIGVVGLKFTPERATLNAMVTLDMAELHGWLSLGAMDICFHPDGLGGDGKGMLYLPLNHDIPFSDSITLRFKKTEFAEDRMTVRDSGTYVSWDCRGFKSINIDGEVIFGRDLLVEDLESGEPGPAQIKAQFAARFRRHGQWLARLNFNHPFQLTGTPGWGFQVEEAWLDFSDGQNPDGFRFPRGYQYDPEKFVGTRDLSDIEYPEYYWKGFYLKRQMIRFPSEFQTRSAPGRRLTGSVQDMLIDRRGLTASFRLENLFEVNDGDLSGWGFSIDTVMVDIAMNSFSRGGFVGEIRIPASDSILQYSSMIRQNIATKNFSYEFRVNPKDTINASLWVAKLALAPTSYISATIDSSGIFARAQLSGKITIDTDVSGAGRINFKLMDFERLGFQTRAPYIDCAENCVRFGFASPQKTLGGEGGGSSGGGLSGFPVSIENIGLTMREGNKAGLQFTLTLNLTGESNTFSAATTLAILGQLDIGAEGQNWNFSGIELDSIGVSGSVGVVELSGGLRFYRSDDTYGNGIKGFIRATFKPTISAQVTAQFGEKSGFRYWYVDAQVVFNPGITLMAGLDVYGFGGGAYYKMRRTTPLPSAVGMTTADTSGRGRPGMTLSGVTFVPDENTNFGFSATLVFGNTGGGNAYNADVTFGASFSESGGISTMYLRGNAYFMCEITDRNEPQVHAMADISYDFAHEIFDARFQVTVNIAGGMVKGVNPGGIAGMVHLYASPETWFIHVGNPETPIGLDLLGLFKTQSYLMVGLNLPSAPPPPPEVASIITPATVVRNPGMETGDGFAFGSRFSFDTGRLGFLIFYARFALGMGFDLSLMNYGPNVFCAGAPPGTTIGVDGWYANGQMYAYMLGDIGIYVDLWLVEGEYKILEVGAAAILQGGMPNPTWVKGTAGGYYNILSGLVKGNCQFEFTVGEECRPAPESPLAGIEILSDLVPLNGETNVDCGISPEASFNAEVNKAFDLEEINSDGTTRLRRFRFVIDYFTLSKGNEAVPNQQQIAPDGFKAMLIPTSFLEPHTGYTAHIRVKGEEFNFTTSSWGPALKRDGTLIYAEKKNTFYTGDYPDRIPDNNVLVSFPFNGQRFFLTNECRTGFVKLKQWMAPLFNTHPEAHTVRLFRVRFIPVDGGDQPEAKLEFQQSSNMLIFQVPELNNEKVYACQIIARDSSTLSQPNTGIEMVNARARDMVREYSTPAQASISVSTIAEVYQMRTAGSMVRNNRINGRSVRKGEKLLYVFYFKTSKYATFREKMATLVKVPTDYANLGALEWLIPKYNGPEGFDVFDMNGYRYTYGYTQQYIKPLVWAMDPNNDFWSMNYSSPIIYNYYKNLLRYNYTTKTLRRANPDTLGIPPTMTIHFHRDNPTRGSLSTFEYMPVSSGLGGFSKIVFTGGASTQMNFGGSPAFNPSSYTAEPFNVKLLTETGAYVRNDWAQLNTITNSIQTYLGSVFTSEFYNEPVRSQMKRYLTTPWTPLSKNKTYYLHFFYRGPFTMCEAPDYSPPPVVKTYNY